MVDPRECTHPHGDHIPNLGFWVCGVCFSKLETQPVKYGMRKPPQSGSPFEEISQGEGGLCRKPARPMRQEIIWRARIATSEENTTLGKFVEVMALRYQRVAYVLTYSEAVDLALELLKGMGDEFGHKSCDWSYVSARELADEDMQETWDAGEHGNR